MEPRNHAIAGGAAAVAVAPGLGLEASIGFFLSSVLIDADHYVDFVWRSRFTEWSPRRMFAFHRALFKRIHDRDFLAISLFHTIECLALVGLAAAWSGSPVITAVLLGMGLHLILDLGYLRAHGAGTARALFVVEYFVRRRAMIRRGLDPDLAYREALGELTERPQPKAWQERGSGEDVRTRPNGMGERSITVVVPALNEEGNIEGTVATIHAAAASRVQRVEILIFNDGSTDRTGVIAETLAVQHPHIRVIHHTRSRGLGFCYAQGVALATGEYVVMMPGDNEVPVDSLATICAAIGTADIVVPYFTNMWIRKRSRQWFSRAFTGLVNTLFGVNLRYFNGPCIHRRVLAQAAMPNTSGFAYMAVLLVRLIRSGYGFKEVGVELGPRNSGRSKALRLKNVISVVISLASLLIETRIMGRRWGVPAPVSAPDVARDLS